MRLLVGDSEKGVRDFLKSSLTSEFFEVDTAIDGEKAFYLTETNEYDLIILDSQLSRKSGVEVCKQIRESNKDIPIIILSVIAEPLKKADILNMGADDYITKPFSFDELLARIRALLRRSGSYSKDIIKIDDLVIDSAKHIVKRGDKKINLTIKEFVLLDYLARNYGNVISRGKILEHVWDMNANPFSNTIEVHISNLRKKIDKPGKKKLIKTIHCIGYKIECA